MILETGNILHLNVWTQLPIKPEIIHNVETVVKKIINVDELLKTID